MKLADWMFINEWTPAKLRRALVLAGHSTVYRYIRGQQTPDRRVLQQIAVLTNGQVTLADFRDPRPPKCAVTITLPNGQTRLVFPFSRSKREWAAVIKKVKAEARPELQSCWQVLLAKRILAPRARPIKDGLYLLDGRIVDRRRLVAAANRIRLQWGLDPIPYPGVDGGRVLHDR